MFIVYHDLIVRQREVELPPACSRCGLPLDSEGALMLREYPCQSSVGRSDVEGQLTVRDISFGPESRRLRTLVACSQCGKAFADGAEVWLEPGQLETHGGDWFAALASSTQSAGYLGPSAPTPPATPISLAARCPGSFSANEPSNASQDVGPYGPWLGDPFDDTWTPEIRQEPQALAKPTRPPENGRTSLWRWLLGRRHGP